MALLVGVATFTWQAPVLTLSNLFDGLHVLEARTVATQSDGSLLWDLTPAGVNWTLITYGLNTVVDFALQPLTYDPVPRSTADFMLYSEVRKSGDPFPRDEFKFEHDSERMICRN